MKPLNKIYICIIALSVLISCFNINAAEWKLHPSFDRTPLRVIDTPDYTYFFVHQQIYNKSYVGYNFPSLTLFQYKKNNPEEGITPLVHEIKLSSADMRLADYSPKGDYLAVVYNDGGVDLIGKDRQLVYIDKLKNYSVPGMSVVNSITFNSTTGDAWVATDAGYMHIDSESKTVKETKVLGNAITAINKFGDRLVAISDSKIYDTDNAYPASFSDFNLISNISTATVLMPLSENCFGYIDGAAGSTRNLKSATLNEGNWTISQLGSDNFYSRIANESLVSRYESNFIPNRDGYLCYSSSKVWQLKAPTEEESANAVSITLSPSSISLGSWDFENFWTYQDRGTFIPRTASYTFASGSNNATATWTDAAVAIRPNAPAAFICTYMSYSPTYGMLAMNHGYDMVFNQSNTPRNPPLLSNLKGNKWELMSYAYSKPNDLSEEQLSLYKSNINRYPLPDPNGLTIDPMFPDWISCGSMFGGFMFQNLSDPGSSVIRYSSADDMFSGFPGVVSEVPSRSWKYLSCFAPPVYDSNGILWTVYSTAFTDLKTYELRFATPEKRELLYSTPLQDINNLPLWGVLDVPLNSSYVYWTCKLLPLKNQSKILISEAPYDALTLYDHKNTLEDSSDDETYVINEIKLPTGEIIESMVAFNDMIENEITGDIIACDSEKIFCIKLPEDVKNGCFDGKILNIQSDNDVLPSKLQVNKLNVDGNGNLWLATNNNGIIVLSPNLDYTIAHYTMENSDLISNTVYGIGINKENNSILASTKSGLIEIPTQTMVSNTKSQVTVYPQHVSPDYNGNIQIKNVGNRNSIIIKNKENEIVKQIYNAENSAMIEWDLTNNDNLKLKSGTYFIIIEGMNPIEINLSR